MRKKILISLCILVFSFIVGGLYINRSIAQVIQRLETVVGLQKVEFLRKDLLAKLEVVQTDLLLKDSPHARNVDIFVQHVEEMDRAANVCFDCHHEEAVLQHLQHVRDEISTYKKQLSRVYTLRANSERLQVDRETAFASGLRVTEEINNIVVTSADKIAQRVSLAGNSIARTKDLISVLLVIGPLIMFGVVFYFVRQITTSMGVLLNGTRVLKTGNLKHRITDKLRDEFQELANSFNDMAASLKDQCLRMQYAERLAVIGELAAGLAHEVKNPLAGIKVSIEVLSNELSLEPEDKEVFLRVLNEISRIETLLKGMLSYARPPQPEPVALDLHHILETTMRNAQFAAKKTGEGAERSKDIQFIKEFGSGIPPILADPAQLQQIFLNLFLNAIDAISEQGKITIKTEVAPGDGVRITIADTGKGMDSQALEKIFLPFFTMKPKGTGLGLSICKRLVELHDGSIDAAANPEGGVTFTITLPLPKRQKNEE